MAAVGCKQFQSVLRNCKLSNICRREIHCCSRLYSVYAEYFKEPVVDKKKIEQMLEEREKDELLAIKVKAAENSQTCSVLYDEDIDRFTNYIMRKGKKALARSLVEETFTLIKHIQLRKYNQETDAEKQKTIILNPREIFSLAVRNTTPLFSVEKVRKSGSWYKVPTGITDKSAKVIAMKWIIEVSKDKDGKIPLVQTLAHELLAASQYEGKAIAKKIELHKMFPQLCHFEPRRNGAVGLERIHFELLPYGRTLNSIIYCEQLDRLKQAIDNKRPELANRKGVVFHQDNARPTHLFLSMANALGGVKLKSKEACEKWLSEFFANKETSFYEEGSYEVAL